ncbi:hypothetical protein NIES2100_23650 [Calothrix sp. NIES-2100]|uniref:hypothetical protein n=1 Tax=Calothrix sp. NIES-2100 TaxID=1954172 RepID=UPI000B5DD971|nr:hypothetical protein NIES2100_23650 [Calothrix sp. NIES-2100]
MQGGEQIHLHPSFSFWTSWLPFFAVTHWCNMEDLELFHFHLERAIYILNFKDKKLAECWVTQLNSNMGFQYTESFLTAAVLELSITNIETFHWVLDNLSGWKPYAQLLAQVTKFILNKLINKGFIPSQDFSFDAQGKILLHEHTKAVIMADTSDSDQLLMEKVLLTPTQVYSLRK